MRTHNNLDECIKRSVNESLNNLGLRQHVRQLVAEEVYRQTMNEEKKKKKKESRKRSTVMKMLQDVKYDHADLAYKLCKPKDQGERDSARSWFSKCCRGELQFSDKDITTLYSILTASK